MMGGGGMQGMHPQQLHGGGGGPGGLGLGGQFPHQQQHPHGNMSASNRIYIATAYGHEVGRCSSLKFS